MTLAEHEGDVFCKQCYARKFGFVDIDCLARVESRICSDLEVTDLDKVLAHSVRWNKLEDRLVKNLFIFSGMDTGAHLGNKSGSEMTYVARFCFPPESIDPTVFINLVTNQITHHHPALLRQANRSKMTSSILERFRWPFQTYSEFLFLCD